MRLFAALGRLNSEIDPSTLSERAVAAANELVAGEITAFDFFELDGTHTGENWYDPPGAISAADFEILAHVVKEHPFVPDIFGKRRRVTMQTNDYLSTSQFRNTAIFNEFYSHFPIHHQLMVPLQVQDDRVVTCTVNRRETGFTEEERFMFDLIAPHLMNTIRNGRRIQQLTAAEIVLASAMEARASGSALIDRDGKIEYMTDRVVVLIKKYFGDAIRLEGSLPDEVACWLSRFNGEEVFLRPPATTLTLMTGNSTLRISRVPSNENNKIVLIFDEERIPSPLELRTLGLTRRQSEVLFWIAQGKTDKDISELLGISPRTVHKHAENIYVVIGVETRTAAMSRAIEVLR